MRTRPATTVILLAMCLGYQGPACAPEPPWGSAGTPDDPDRDQDGYPESEDCYDCSDSMSLGCSGGPTVICEDAHPGATETCNGIDDNCDGERDNGATGTNASEELDLDGDGWTDPDNTEEYCDSSVFWEGSAFSFSCSGWGGYGGSGDCDDENDEVHPEAAEECDGIDNDCDGLEDEDSPDAYWWYPDDDGDGYGDPAEPVQSCDQPPGFTDLSGDCDDLDEDVHPDATEVCDNGVDDDCDGLDEPCGDDDDSAP